MKRIFDVVGSILALTLLFPVMLVVALVIRLKLGSPIIFSQVRPGLHAEPFTMLKFRTMTDARDTKGKLLPDAERLTSFGKFLRATSLDELPELLNVLKGEMSLVGPRPLLMDYVPLYSPTQFRRHEMRPGVTGWAQVNGRNGLDWNERFKLDVWYVDNHSLLLDIRILGMTISKVVRREGINQQGEATMQPFLGNGSGVRVKDE